MLFWKKKEPPKLAYDPETQEPVIRQSICKPEAVGGLLHKKSGKFQEIMLLTSQEDKEFFCQRVGLAPDQIKTIY